MNYIQRMIAKMRTLKETAAERRKRKDRRKSIPPRSMTDAEREYYAIHKNLNGMYK
jgi:hypothetical protein